MVDDVKFQALHEHYNNTFSNIKESIKSRDRLMALVLLTLTIVVLYSLWPSGAVTAFSQITAHEFGLSISLNSAFLGSIIWFALLIVIVRYTQVVVYIERQYAYIHRIEESLHEYYKNGVAFTREGKSYLEKYPSFSNWICLLYTTIFPLVLTVIVLSKIISELVFFAKGSLLPLLLNTIVAICILVSIALYILFMYKQNKDN